MYWVGNQAEATVATTNVSQLRQLGAMQRAYVDDNSGAAITLVAGVPGKRIQLWGCTFTTASATTLNFKSGTNTLTGAMNASVIHIDPEWGPIPATQAIPWLETNVGESLTVTAGGAVQVSGPFMYSVLP
jgi:hypothetical protein